jgi:predicted metalloprotease
MEWEQSRESANIEDRRGEGGGGGGGFSIGGGGGGLGIGAILVILAIGYFTGIDPRLLMGGAQILTGGGNSGAVRAPAQTTQTQSASRNDPMRQFVAKVLAQTEDVWTKILPEQKGVKYEQPKLVLYSGATRSGCGQAQAAMGPFYCPNDQKVYLDMSFFNDMRSKYGGGGDFAYAYVIAHEIGHHVQDQLGILSKVDDAKAQMSRTQANALSVRVELMADCLAGVWAYNANQEYRILDPGDVEKALATAQAIGDDRLQTAARGYAVPDSFTHGSAAMRQKWLQTGLNSGQVDSCNTFKQ